MYEYKTSDAGILFTGLSNYKSEVEKDVKIEELPVSLKDHFTKTIKRIDEILEEI